MKRFAAILTVLLTAVVFLTGSQLLKNQLSSAQIGPSSISEHCDSERLRCKAFASIFKDIDNLKYDLKRRSIDKSDLPVLRIYMSDGAINKIDQKRKSVLNMRRPIHISEDGDWVNGSAIVEHGTRKEKSKITLRLKGDWGGHMDHPKKLSFRIKTRAGGYLFGVKTFSIQHPKTRHYANEPMALKHMRSHDILAPKSQFVDVHINGHSIGVMNMEEHFKKEMLEAQDRRDGPILAMDEGDVWAQRDLAYNRTTPHVKSRMNFFPYRDSPIKNYRSAKFERGTIPTNNELRAVSKLRDYFYGNADVRETFDYDLLSKYWVLTNIWGGCHATVWHNRRYYFNPISGLFEPVSFDNNASLKNEFQFCLFNEVKLTRNDPRFIAHVREFSHNLAAELSSKAFQDQFALDAARYQEMLELESFEDLLPTLTVENLQENLEKFTTNFERSLKTQKNRLQTNMSRYGDRVTNMVKNDLGPFALHLTVNYFPEPDGKGKIEFRSMTPSDIEILSVYYAGKKKIKANFDMEPFRLLSANKDPSVTSLDVNIPDDQLRQKGDLYVDYKYLGQEHRKIIPIQHRFFDSGFTETPLKILGAIIGEAQINRTTKQIVIKKGTYEFTDSIELPRDWKTIIKPGANISFKNGSLLKLRGPLFVEGKKNKPVRINVESNLTYKDMGRWGGIFVSSAKTRSKVTHMILEGTGTQNLANRQGYYGMTGCFSFYNSDVTISHSEFNSAQCEDALNIVKSDFILTNIIIAGARADAFDSDFSVGLVKDSIFKDSGNDGVDVSGTKLELQGLTMTNIGDKAVSVGEKSTLQAKNIDIKGAVLGVASKDLSEAIIEDIRFEGISGTALMTYIKKQEYGPSLINCKKCVFEPGTVISGRQDGTKIIVNGKNDRNGFLTRKQMIDSGLVEGSTAL